MQSALIGIICAVIGAFFGYFFRRLERQNEYKKIRTAFKLEIERNREKLIKFWDDADQEPEDWDVAFLCKAVSIDRPDLGGPQHRILDADVPLWSLKIWNAHIETAASAFYDKDFNEIYSFYENILKIEGMYSRLKDFDDRDSDQREQLSKLWIEFEKLILETKSLAQSIKV